MDLLIMSKEEAVKYVPDRPTYAIRIFSSWNTERDRIPLQDSPNYVHTEEYIFDDNDDIHKAGPAWITEDIARKILDDFSSRMEGIEYLLIHCYFGKNRSPAVAMALNEVFGLGNNLDHFKKEFPIYNTFVYEILKRVAKHEN